MKQIMTIFAFTFRDGIKKKVFIISTIIVLALILILTSIPAIISLVNQNDNLEPPIAQNDDSTAICFYIDKDGLIDNAIDTLSGTFLDTKFESGNALELEQYKDTIKTNGNISIIMVEQSLDGMPFITITTKDFMKGISTNNVVEVLSDLYIFNTLNAQGIKQETILFAQSRLDHTQEYIGLMDINGYMLGNIITMLIFFAIYLYGYGVAMSVATEKTSRVIETLVVSAKPSRILLGKCIGTGFVGLVQLLSILLFGVLCYTFLVPEGYMIFGMELSFSAFSLKSAFFIVIYFLLGYALYAMLNAVSGAYVSKIEDLNSALLPINMISMISFYIGYFSIITQDNSAIRKISMYVPFVSPFIMPFNLLNGEVTNADLFFSILLLVIAILIVTVISIKIYSASVIHYGKGLKLNNLYKVNK